MALFVKTCIIQAAHALRPKRIGKALGKTDAASLDAQADEFYKLGRGRLIKISAHQPQQRFQRRLWLGVAFLEIDNRGQEPTPFTLTIPRTGA